jgi:hypothetical protein
MKNTTLARPNLVRKQQPALKRANLKENYQFYDPRESLRTRRITISSKA